jgi:hypothetical protein
LGRLRYDGRVVRRGSKRPKDGIGIRIKQDYLKLK